MKDTASLRARAFRGLALFIAAMAVLIFLPAWTLLWWQAWLFLAVFTAAVLAITLYFLERDPALIERRMNAGPAAETEVSQRRGGAGGGGGGLGFGKSKAARSGGSQGVSTLGAQFRALVLGASLRWPG